MNSLVLLAFLGFVLVSNAAKLKKEGTKMKKCGACERDACPSVNCLAGKMKDACGCCDICNKMEGEACDPSLEPRGYGECGTGLACMDIGEGHYCLCETDEVICGSDDVTYNNICQMFAASARSGKTIEHSKDGPCDPAAKIVTAPEYTRNYTGGSVILSCEAVGNPVPYIAWFFTSVDKKSFSLPGDDDHMLTAARGGPGRFQVTGWLQIEDLQKKHEGDYTCVAKNGDKKVLAKARVKVKDGQDRDL